MIRVRIWFSLCFALAFFTIVGLWYYGLAGAVNALFAACTWLAEALADFLSRLCGVNPVMGTELLINRMNGGILLAIGLVGLLWYLLIGWILNSIRAAFHRPKHSYRILGVIICILVVHVVLDILWLTTPETMKAWYGMHEKALVQLFKERGWHQAQTIFLKTFQLHNLVVYLEALMVYLLATQIVRFVFWLIKKFFAGLFWLWNSAFGGR